MRLLNTQTLQLETWEGKPPKYAILSHTWGNAELLFSEINNEPADRYPRRAGFKKVSDFCHKALSDGHLYAWVDTCCINKDSSAELSEAINSMFSWYNQSTVCYAYLEDITKGSPLKSSRWFTRGWTLQELIAPTSLHVYDKDWMFIGNRFSLATTLAEITGIHETVLRHGHSPYPQELEAHYPGETEEYFHACGSKWWYSVYQDGLAQFSVAHRMSWASKRCTTRQEDMGYCLFGIFDINLPLIYGEGPKAFTRVQEAIIQRTQDQSILAFRVLQEGDILASDPSCFSFGDIHQSWAMAQDIDVLRTPNSKMYLENNEIQVNILLCPLEKFVVSRETALYLGILDCTLGMDLLSRPAIILQRVSVHASSYRRCYSETIFSINGLRNGYALHSIPSCEPGKNNVYAIEFDLSQAQYQDITIVSKPGSGHTPAMCGPPVRVRNLSQPNHGRYHIASSFPEGISQNFLFPNPKNLRGIVMVHKEKIPSFCVVWELHSSNSFHQTLFIRSLQYATMWCKIWSIEELKLRTDCEVEATAIGQDIMRSFRHKHDWNGVLYPSLGFKKPFDYCCLQNENEQVTAKFNLASFLGSAILELEIEIVKSDASAPPRLFSAKL